MRNDASACQHGQIFQHGLATITKSRCFDGQGVKRATQLVEHKRGQGFAIDIFGNDDQFLLTGLRDFFQKRQNFSQGRNLFVGDQDFGVLIHRFHAIRIGDHVMREVAFIELHAFHHFFFDTKSLAFFHSDHTVFANAFDSFGNNRANLFIIGRDGRDMSHFVFAADFFG